MKKIWIIGAMQEEIDELLQTMDQKEEQGGYFTGNLWNYEIVLVKSGIGKVNAAMTTQKLISEFHVEAIINTGIAGAMQPWLKVFDFVLSTDALHHDFDVTGFGYKMTEIPRMETSCFEADPQLRQTFVALWKKEKKSELFQEIQLIEGRIASWDQFIADKEKKEKIIEICHPACVEMEGAAIAQVCYVNKIPFIILRCMSDCADEQGTQTYEFNDKTAAALSSTLVKHFLES